LRVSRLYSVQLRLHKVRRKVELNTQKLRKDLIEDLAEIFRIAKTIASGEVKIGDKKSALRQRNAWARVAAYTAQLINGIAAGFDEKRLMSSLTFWSG